MIGVRYFRDREFPEIEIKTCTNSVHASKKHAHEELSIGLVEKGTSVYEYEGRMFEVGPSHLVVIPPEIIHQCSPQSYDHWQFKMLYIRPSWLKIAFGIQTLNYIPTSKMLDAKSIKQTKNLFRILLSNLPLIQKESCLIRDLPGLVNFGHLRDQECFNHYNIEAFRLSQEYLHENFLERITLDNLATITGLSKYYLIRLFNKLCGVSPHGYLTMLRVNYAKRVLLKNKSITDVAAELGFYDQSHFSNTFKQYVGITPDYYRKLK
ncbi:Transcriptional regulator, AraC family [Desulfosporosinus sp. BG]|nr:Transcriptional regulator, AraC family [Desulfosporosinus sp. BG]